jgi:hypothetical protein
MGIESGNYINDLNESWPTATDNVSDGDNHLRLIKKVVKDSFPGVDRVSEYIYVHTSAPTVSVGKGRLWLDTSTTPNLLKIYDGSAFKKLPISATVDYKLMGNDTVGWVLPTADGTANYPLTTTGSNVLAFAQVDTTAIANNAVDGTKIAMGSDAAGDVLYYNGTDYVRLAKGSAGQELQVNSGATAPEWADAVAGSSSFRMTLSGTQTISNATPTQVSFNTSVFDNSGGKFDTSTYDFEAPATGVYYFNAGFRTTTHHSADDDLYIYNTPASGGGKVLKAAHSTYRYQSGAYITTASSLIVSCLISLTIADKVSVWVNTEGGSSFDIAANASMNFFEGYRLT